MSSVTSDHDVSDINLFDVPTLKDPWDAYKRLRDHAPVYYMPGFNVHVITLLR